VSWRAAPGEQIATGRLRVDAAKAIAKLREYQLVDRTAWILEAIRAAVASSATRVELQGDSNDVWLSWDGEPWPVEDLPRLFDELVSPEPGASRHHVRLLAAAVNSALGANPAYIDVYAIGDEGAHRVRYTPEILESHDGDLEDAPLRRLQAQPAARPDGTARGMHVHYRRRASLGVITTFLLRAEPPELQLARRACADIAVPMQIGGDTYDRATGASDIVRVPLGDDVEGWLAITDQPITDEARMGVAERGVLLETRAADTGLRASRIPVRVFVDAPRMPTNASRSEVRVDIHPVSTAIRRAGELMPAAIAKLAEKCSVAQLDVRARTAALQLLTDAIAGYDWAMRAPEIAPPLRALAELPLVRDAAGIPRPMCWSWNGFVYTGDEPLSPDLAPWLSRILWAPLWDPVRALAQYANPMALRLHLKDANRQRRAEKKFYKHAKREARVLDRRAPRIRYTLGTPVANSCIPDGMFDGLAGEVCVYTNRRGGSMTVMLSGREIETIDYDSAIGFAAVVDSQHVTPNSRYRGVARDSEYLRVEQAMRAGVIRAVESITRPLEEDAALIRYGLSLARELDRPLSPAFASAKVWSALGGLVSIDELRAHPVIGYVPPHATVTPLRGRPILRVETGEAQLLARYVKSRFVAYEPHLLTSRLEPHELAERIVATHALGLAENDLVIAVKPSSKPELRLLHRGVELATWAYAPSLAPCMIAIDSDEIVPTEDWHGVADDAGVCTRDMTGVERALARAAVQALAGTRAPGLAGETPVEPTSVLGRWLWESLLLQDPVTVLGEELVTVLRTRPLFRMLGESRLFSIDELAIKFPQALEYVPGPTEPADGVAVLVADPLVARVIARLCQREARDISLDLAQRRMQLARDLRIGMHRAKPAMPLEVAGTYVQLESAIGRGVVGVGRDVLEIQVLVEGRPFQTITRADDIPLAAVIDLGLAQCDAKFEQLEPGVEGTLVSLVRNKAPDLARAIADAYPDALSEPGPRRSMLARFISRVTPLAPYVCEALGRTIVFPTVQRGRTTIADARGQGTIVPTCAWHGEWLAADGDPHRLDNPIIYTGSSPELREIVGALCSAVDVTRDVENLQTQRRIARGLLPAPRVTGADPELVFPLSVLGNAYRHLGPGEIALTSENNAAALVHVNGALRARMALDTTPAILLAIEASDLVDNQIAVDIKLATHARMMAIDLAKYVLAKRSADSLPPAIRASLRAAMLAGTLTDLRDAPVFETAIGAWVDLAAVQAQRELFSNLWCVAAPTSDTPLDERRIVLVLSSEHQLLAREHGIPVVDATQELVLDAKTRRNMAKPPLESLAIDGDDVLARVELPGDGVGAPRGVVAVLSPRATGRRGLQLSRRMHPFDPVSDPCRWPTRAMIDDERFTPDRTWEAPEKDAIHKAAIEALHRASHDALRSVVQPPASALAALRVTPWTYDSIALLRDPDLQIRGALWLAGPPLPLVTPAISVIDARGTSTFVPLHGANLAGTLYVHALKAFGPAEKLLEEVCSASHAKLVRELLITRSRRDKDLTASHVAWALALGRITAEDAKHVELACFRPAPLDAEAALRLFASKEPVVVVTPESKLEGPCFVDDGSETARVVRTILGERLRSATQRMRPDTIEPPPPVVVKHPLQAFVDRLHGRIIVLGVPVARWRIVDERSEPIASFSEDGVLELAARNQQLLAIAASIAANTAWSADALDAIAAHCITVLNVALTSITDAAEARAISKLLG
jgi:hypothetical protein